MAYQIRITPDQMRERANQYRTQAEIIAEVIARMDSLLAALQGEWEGAACAAFTYRYEELVPGFRQVEDMIRQIAAALDSTARIFEETDQQIASQLRDSWQVNAGTPEVPRYATGYISPNNPFTPARFITF